MTPGYARPDALQGAYELLATPGALPMFGGTDLMGQIDPGIVARDDRGPAAALARHDRGAR
jgi:CO/xanthine dehydrogenase FAD-binding subunit